MTTKDFIRVRLFILLLLLISFKGYSQSCTLSVSLSSSSSDICSGNAVTLTPAITGGTGPYSYAWSTGETTQTINVNKAGTYTVSVTDKSTGCIAKQSIAIGTSTMPNPPTVHSATVCENSPATLTALAPGGTYQWYDAPTGGNFLATGDSYTTPPITKSTTYYVQTTLSGCTSARTAVNVYTAGRPGVTGASVCSGSGATISASGGDNYVWYDSASETNQVGSGPNFNTPALTKTTTYYVVATVNGCVSAPTPATVYVNPPPQIPTSSNVTICSGTAASLHADAPAGIFDWFDVPTGGISLISSPDYTTPVLTATKTYYVQTSSNGCQSARQPVTVIVNPIPAAPVTQTTTICYGTSTDVTTTSDPSATYQWYDAAVGGRLLTTGITYHTPVLNNTTTYYIQTVNGGCISSRTPVQVIVNPQVAAPVASGAIVCSGSATLLTARSTTNGIYQWYSAASGGKLLTTDSTYTTPALTATTKYYVQTTVGSCTSARTEVTVTVLPPVAAPTVSGNTTVCSGNYTILTASGGKSGSYKWYDAATSGNLLSSGQVFVTPELTANATYYVQSTSNGCESTRTPVTVTVNPLPSSPTISGGTSVCAGSTTTLTASAGAGGSVSWYASATGNDLLASGNNYTTPALNETTTYYAQNNAGSCPSSRTPVTVTVTQPASAHFQYPSGTYGSTANNPTPVINDPAGGTFVASPAGLVFASNTTGEVDIKDSKKGSYTITFTTNGPCPSIYSTKFVIDSIPNGSFGYNGPYCQDGGNQYPTLPANASAGVFSASPKGLAFVNVTTGEIDVSASKPGTYTVSNTISLGDGSPASVSTAKVTIDAAVRVNAGPDQTVKTGTPVKLAGSISGASGGTWSGGNGTFSNPTAKNAVYTPATGETKATLTLTSSDPPGLCGPKSDQVVITILNIPTAPTAPGTPVCMGSGTTLSALAPGGIYKWYDSATGGTLLSTGPNYITPALTANTTYYVQTTVNGVTSARTAVNVTVNTTPIAPVVPVASTCLGSPAVITAGGSTGTYQWYDAAAGGNLLSTGATFTTTPLTINTTYYVQAVINDCVSPRTRVNVSVNPVPNVTSAPNDLACGGVPLNYTITADIPGATYSWSRAAVTGISNPAVSAQTSGIITEALVNTAQSPIDVTYLITPLNNGCSGPVFKYVVTVYPTPAVTSTPTATICDNTTDNYGITFSVPQTVFNWGRAVVPGISNAAVSGQTAGTIREVLFNTTTAPIAVPYIINYQTSNCQAQPFIWTETVNPTAYVTSADNGITCSGTPQSYTITSNIPSATYVWRRDTANSISNKPVSNQTSATIDETLVNTSQSPVKVSYIITPIAFGCPGPDFAYTVTLNPQPALPAANSNSPVCLDNTVHLLTPVVQNASYLWTGPNGYTSTLQNPDITNATLADTGTYRLYVTVNSCTSLPGITNVAINPLPKANAGKDTLVCINVPSIQLNGSVSGGTTTGTWSPSGTGKFSPSANVLNAQYIPSDQDRANGKVTLTLTSTSKDDCSASISDMTITFGPSPGADAGANQNVCIHDASVPLAGKILVPGGNGGKWSTAGSGSFVPSETDQATAYLPSDADRQNGSVKLTLTANNPGECFTPSGDMTITFTPPPTVNAGGTRYVLRGKTITLEPVVSEDNVQYLWSPNIGISDVTAKNPIVTGDLDITYTLQVTDSRGCVNSDKTNIIVSPELVIPNAFTPNGDGINDYWDIKGLIAYSNAVIDIFNRYGTNLYHSIGYPNPWDGKYNGQQLPVGTYYYIIKTNVNDQVLSGSLTIIR